MPVAGGGFEQCYNAQAVVAADSLLVVAIDLVQAANSLPSRKRGTSSKSSRCWASWRHCRRISAGRKRCSATMVISAPRMSRSVLRQGSSRCWRSAGRRITRPWTSALPRHRPHRRTRPARSHGAPLGHARRQEALRSAKAHPGAGVRDRQIGSRLSPIPAARARQGPRRVEPGDDGVEHEADLRSQYSITERRLLEYQPWDQTKAAAAFVTPPIYSINPLLPC